MKWVALTATRFSKANDRRPLEKYSFLRDRFLFTVIWDVKSEVKRDLKTVAGHPRMQISLQKMKNKEIVV